MATFQKSLKHHWDFSLKRKKFSVLLGLFSMIENALSHTHKCLSVQGIRLGLGLGLDTSGRIDVHIRIIFSLNIF